MNEKKASCLLSIHLLLILNMWALYGTQAPEIGIVERLDQYVSPDIELISIAGDTVLLQSLLGKPTVLSLVYYRCPGICSPLMNGMAEVIRKSDMTIGDDYQALTISFDPRETNELARRKRETYLSQVPDDKARPGWHFFVADSTNIARITSQTGFYYKPTGNDFQHAAVLIILSADGKITRYLNGTNFLPFEFKMALVEAGRGQSSPTINRILEFCYTYDPKGQQYVLNITKVSGVMILFILVIIFLFLTIKPLFRAKATTN